MKKRKEERLKEAFTNNYTPEQQEAVQKNVVLQYRALKFVTKKLCRTCRYKLLSRVRSGEAFKPGLLCESCKTKYANEVKQ